MVFPSTWLAALCLLLFASICLGIWPTGFPMAGRKYRFEVFSLDFAIGAVVLSLLAAFTFGTLGSELSFSDTMLVSGRRSQVMAFSAGAVFALGNMLMLAAVSLIGQSRAVLLTWSISAAIMGAFSLTRGNYALVSPSVLLFLMSMCLGLLEASTIKAPPLPRPKGDAGGPKGSRRLSYRPPGVRNSVNKRLSPGTKGIILSIMAGLALGLVLPVVSLAEKDELAIGPYGGVLMGCLGILVVTPFLNFYFMNLAIEGTNLTVHAYLEGKPKQRLLGAASGALWAAGALALYVVVTTSTHNKAELIDRALTWATPLGAVIVTAVCGFFVPAGEVGSEEQRTKLVYWAMALFVCGATLLVVAQSSSFKA